MQHRRRGRRAAHLHRTDQPRYTQAERVALRLAAEHQEKPFDALYVGPRIRLRQTAEIISQALQIPMLVDERLDGPVHAPPTACPGGT